MLTRAPAVGGMIVTLLLSSAASASAGGWGSVDCAQESSPYCELGAGKTGKMPGGNGGVPDEPSRNGGGGKATPPPGDRIVGGNSPAATCSYVRSNYQPPANGVQTVAFRPASQAVPPVVLASAPLPRARSFVAQQGGAWYVYRCTGPGFHDGMYRSPIWLPDGAAPAGAGLPSPQELAEQARTQLRLPSPHIEANPPGDKLVSLPTWLWLDRGSWGTRQATAARPTASRNGTRIGRWDGHLFGHARHRPTPNGSSGRIGAARHGGRAPSRLSACCGAFGSSRHSVLPR